MTKEPKWQPKVGDHCGIYYYTDIHPATVIKRTEKFVWIQEDKYQLQKDWKPEIVAGGFAGHCTNNNSQRYDFTRNEDGAISKFSLRKSGNWCRCGDNSTYPTTIYEGWRAFYDYNF
tara:strand:- start:1374 stop:1724 length:351 start_codon:yes stop_codon:yes gene_type:complete